MRWMKLIVKWSWGAGTLLVCSLWFFGETWRPLRDQRVALAPNPVSVSGIPILALRPYNMKKIDYCKILLGFLGMNSFLCVNFFFVGFTMFQLTWMVQKGSGLKVWIISCRSTQNPNVGVWHGPYEINVESKLPYFP